MTPDYLVIGHLTKDLTTGGGFRLGGTAAYAAVTAARLGMRAAMVTAFGRDLEPWPSLPGIGIAAVPSQETTTFRNVCRDEEREQFLLARASPITIHHVPPLWRTASIVHLGPVAQEVAPAMAGAFPASFLGLTPQGWLRRWDDGGRVYCAPWLQAAEVLPQADAVALSQEDVRGDEARLKEYAASTPILAVTMGSGGCWVHWKDEWRHFPAFEVEMVDATGAGDVFAAAFFIALAQGWTPWRAACYANAAASFAVAAEGRSGLATAEQVQQRMEQMEERRGLCPTP